MVIVIKKFWEQIDPSGFFPFSKVPQLLSNLFISVMDNNGGFFSLFFKDATTFVKSN
jgi:hypothetical protein